MPGRKRGPATEQTPQVERREASASIARRAAPQGAVGCASRRSASPRFGEGRKEKDGRGRTPRRPKNRGGGALACEAAWPAKLPLSISHQGEPSWQRMKRWRRWRRRRRVYRVGIRHPFAGRGCGSTSLRGVERRSNPGAPCSSAGLLRFARNDDDGCGCLGATRGEPC